MNAELLSTEALLASGRLVVRPLTADDSAAYRALRKKIAEVGDGRYFSGSYRRDKQFKTETQWREWCTKTADHCVVGTFIDGELVGLMTALAQEPKGNHVAEWDSVWLDPRFRRHGIAKLAYEQREEWTRTNGYKYAEVFIRDDNERSLEIRAKRGAVYTRTKRNEVWADGSIADAHFFMCPLSPADEIELHDRVMKNMEEALAALKDEDQTSTETIEQKRGAL